MMSVLNAFSQSLNASTKSSSSAEASTNRGPPLALWHVNIDGINGDSDFDELVKTVAAEEREKILRFYFMEDRKRALLSVLLQRAVIRHRFGLMESDYHLKRTLQKKPYLYTTERNMGTWNFNVSHHGKYVCIASHSDLLVGVDIVDTLTRSPSVQAGAAMDFIAMFASQLTASEVQTMRSLGSDEDRYTHFFAVWSLKESYIKAIGLGLGFDLRQIEFDVHILCDGVHESHSDYAVSSALVGWATISISGAERDDWRFDFAGLDDRHIMTVARGPITDAIPSYQAASGWDSRGGQTPEARAAHQALLAVPVGRSELKTVESLLRPRELIQLRRNVDGD